MEKPKPKKPILNANEFFAGDSTLFPSTGSSTLPQPTESDHIVDGQVAMDGSVVAINPDRSDNRSPDTSVINSDEVSILDIIDRPKNNRVKQRYSFEAFKDQIDTTDELSVKYRKKTGTRFNTSKFLRELWDKGIKELKEKL